MSKMKNNMVNIISTINDMKQLDKYYDANIYNCFKESLHKINNVSDEPASEESKKVSVGNIYDWGESSYSISGLSFGLINLYLSDDSADFHKWIKLDFPNLNDDDYFELRDRKNKSFHRDLENINLSCFYGLVPWEILDILDEIE